MFDLWRNDTNPEQLSAKRKPFNFYRDVIETQLFGRARPMYHIVDGRNLSLPPFGFTENENDTSLKSSYPIGNDPVSKNLVGKNPVGKNLVGKNPGGKNLVGKNPIGKNLVGKNPVGGTSGQRKFGRQKSGRWKPGRRKSGQKWSSRTGFNGYMRASLSLNQQTLTLMLAITWKVDSLCHEPKNKKDKDMKSIKLALRCKNKQE